MLTSMASSLSRMLLLVTASTFIIIRLLRPTTTLGLITVLRAFLPSIRRGRSGGGLHPAIVCLPLLLSLTLSFRIICSLIVYILLHIGQLTWGSGHRWQFNRTSIVL